MKEYLAILNVRLVGDNDEEIQHQLENLCNLMRQIGDIVQDVTVDDYYELQLPKTPDKPASEK